MNKPRILLAPLDWGLGHASRCIPIIQHLTSLQCEVVLAGSGDSFYLLKKEFNNLESISLQNYSISYPSGNFMTFYMMMQFPSMLSQIKEEKRNLAELITEHNISAVISDNRYGLINENVPCVLITHQLNPPVKFFPNQIRKYVHRLINQFDQCWIPDYVDENSLAGKVSHFNGNDIANTTYIGPLSRFKPKDSIKDVDVLAIISGPENQRTLFETGIIKQLNKLEGMHVIVRGTNEKASFTKKVNDHITVIDMLDSYALEEAINSAKFLISRSGYSSIMDYMSMGRNALLVPTPGQYEQLFLAEHHKKRKQFIVQSQGELNIEKALSELSQLHAPTPISNGTKLKEVLEDFCESLY